MSKGGKKTEKTVVGLLENDLHVCVELKRHHENQLDPQSDFLLQCWDGPK